MTFASANDDASGQPRPDHVDLCVSDDIQLGLFRSGESQLRKPEVYEEIIVVLLSQASTVPMTTSEQTLVTTVRLAACSEDLKVILYPHHHMVSGTKYR